MKTGYLIYLIVFLVCLCLRTGYELLKKAGKVNPESKVLFTIILTIMILLWVSWFGMCPVDSWQLSLPQAVTTSGLVLVLIGLVLALGALAQLRGVENIDHLVTTGLFSVVRHPMYFGFILWIVGWSVYHGAAVSALAGCAGIANILYWRQLEETKLSETYGEVYKQYKHTTVF
ncbi:MAG TPA: isoprenylcysteine carboxylmethyltransferase family protein [Bacteroidota bacterium]